MIGENRLESEFLVNVLDMKALSKITVLYLIGGGYEINGNTRISTHYPLGIVTGKNGKHYIIDKDGCGDSGALEDTLQKITWYKSTIDEKGNVISFDMFPVEVTFDKAELENVPITSVETLDKFFRFSGSGRIERLYRNWTKFLTTGIEPSY